MSPEEKRANMIHAVGKPQIGRREPPSDDIPKANRRTLITGILLGAVVVAVTVIIIAVVAANNPL